MVQLFLRLRKERGSSSYVLLATTAGRRAMSRATIFREIGISYDTPRCPGTKTPRRGTARRNGSEKRLGETPRKNAYDEALYSCNHYILGNTMVSRRPCADLHGIAPVGSVCVVHGPTWHVRHVCSIISASRICQKESMWARSILRA
jgi:hypothetical protein